MRMAERVGLRKSAHSSNIDCLTRPNGLVDAKEKSRGLSNRDGPPAEMETAAQAGPLNGGEIGKASSTFNGGRYSMRTLAAMGGAA